MATSSTQVGNLSITTQVLPAGDSTLPALATLPTTPNWAQVLAQKKKQPIKSLSAVIILIGVLQLMIGTSMYFAEKESPSLVSRSFAFLGSLVFIMAGIVSVIFANDENITKIKICLFSHAINVVSAAIVIVLYAVQVHTDSQACWALVEYPNGNECNPGNSTYNPNDYNHYYYGYQNYGDYVYTLRVSLNSLVLFYIIFGLIISSCIILLRWKLLQKSKYALLEN
ncbi:hypothetical protein GDO81_022829 [Engystomops pustulosus]|uniref:Uncharacterized protein n=1 Tax=Engystomops pustulosus TaxID=76066 RepID=A0AAV6YT94_ENGPU|nr:hypothetical protein GDO81_022829 [Engystomops pustulosus]